MDTPAYLLLKDFLSLEDNQELLAHTIGLYNAFRHSQITYGSAEQQSSSTENQHLNNWRKSLTAPKKDFEKYYRLLSDAIRPAYPEICSKLGIPSFELSDIEMQLTSHNDGDFYKPHADNSSKETQNRALTFVYYFHSIPKEFTGGQLLIFQPKATVIEPANNTIVFFDPALQHAVHPVSCPGKKFEHSRFTLNGWLRKK